jgi:hypothetical protein
LLAKNPNNKKQKDLKSVHVKFTEKKLQYHNLVGDVHLTMGPWVSELCGAMFNP